MTIVTNFKLDLENKVKTLKDRSGTHSPSIITIREKIPELQIKVDACFLSNPYATDLFLKNLEQDLISNNKIRDVLEFYPSQNVEISESLSKCLDTSPKHIFIGNGAVEIIQAVIHNFTKKNIVVNIPTFSPYYEFVKDSSQVIFNKLDKQNSYKLDIDKFLNTVDQHNPDTVIIINPNNPDGGYVSLDQIEKLLKELKDVENVIVDESFIHFAFEDDCYGLKTCLKFVSEYDNLIVLKSMSKDFGIAGIRAGYAVMSPKKVEFLLRNGYLWNSNGLAEYFFRLYSNATFIKEYETVRIQYIKETQEFFNRLSKLSGLKVYPSMANFSLVELINGMTADEFVIRLLVDHGVYVRSCSDKIGLEGEFVRVASRNKEENSFIVKAIEEVLSRT